MIKTILCAVDGSKHGEKALEWAIDLADKHEARLLLIHALLEREVGELRHFAEIEALGPHVRPELKRLESRESFIRITEPYQLDPAPMQFLANIGEHVLKAAESEARARGVEDVEVHLTMGDAARRILEYAKRERADCIVMGTRGLSGVKALVLGSVSHTVCNKAPCTCITVR